MMKDELCGTKVSNRSKQCDERMRLAEVDVMIKRSLKVSGESIEMTNTV